MGKRERRTLAIPFEVRASKGDEGRRIGGHIPYDTESQVLRDIWGDLYVEVLAPGCFDNSLKVRDVVALWAHDTSQVLGGTKSGTLRLTTSAKRLDFDIDLPDTQAGRDAFESIQRRDVDGVSFGMVVTEDKWSKAERDGQEIYKRTILEAELWEISPTVFAAYTQTQIDCRSLAAPGEGNTVEDKSTTNTQETVDKVETGEDANMADKAKTTEVRTVPAVAISPADRLREQRIRFNHYLRTGEVRDTDALLVSGSGGALAPEDFAKEIIDGLADEVVMRQLARILPPITGKSAAYPRRTEGSGAAMVAEGDPIVPYDLTFDQVILTPKKAAAIVEVSNELLQDTGVDLAGYLARHFTEEIGELLENQYWNGTGEDAELLGILAAEDGEDGLLIDRVPSDESEIDVADIFALWGALPAKYRRNATFVCSGAMETLLRGLQDGNGQYLMVRNLTDAMSLTLLGRPLVVTDAFPSDLGAGDDALLVGDFRRGVYIADKVGIDIQRNDSAGFYSDVTAFRAIFRTDIALALPDAFRILAVKSGS